MEYGLIVFAIAAVITAVVFAFGGIVNELFDSSCQTIASKATPADSDCRP